MTPSRAARAALAGSLLLLGALLCAPAAFADDGPAPPPVKAPPSETDLLPIQDTLVTIVVKGLLVAAGAGVLVREYLRRDRIRGGLLPPPVPVEPTVPFAALPAVGILVLAFAALELVKLAAVRNRPELEKDLGFAFLLTAAVELPLAGVIALRRRRLGANPPVRTAVSRGLAAFLAAQAGLLPVALLWAQIITLFGGDPTAIQDLARRVLRPEEPWHPWAIAAFGVFVAPLVEEAIFRGMLYPAFRAASGGGRRGAWVSALVTSLLFAAIHGNLLALVPLFCLALILSWVMETTNSLLACTITHAASNFVSLALLLWFQR